MNKIKCSNLFYRRPVVNITPDILIIKNSFYQRLITLFCEQIYTKVNKQSQSIAFIKLNFWFSKKITQIPFHELSHIHISDHNVSELAITSDGDSYKPYSEFSIKLITKDYNEYKICTFEGPTNFNPFCFCGIMIGDGFEVGSIEEEAEKFASDLANFIGVPVRG